MYDWQQTSPSCFPKNGKQNSSGFGGYGQPYQTYNNNIGFNHHMSRYQVYQGYQGHSNGGEGEQRHQEHPDVDVDGNQGFHIHCFGSKVAKVKTGPNQTKEENIATGETS